MGQLQPLEDLRRRCEHADIPLQFWQMINEKFSVVNNQKLRKETLNEQREIFEKDRTQQDIDNQIKEMHKQKETIFGVLREKVYSLDEVAKKTLEREQNRNNEETRGQDNKKKFDFEK